MPEGLFITFEGIDGSGKTTAMERAAKDLTEEGFDVLTTREPGATELGQKIREVLLSYEGEVSDECEKFLFLADRAWHVDSVIRPALKAGKIVLCDRYIDSTLAYQGFGRGGNIAELEALNNSATGNLKPDLTLLFDLDIETALERAGKNKDRMESAGAKFFSRTKRGYLELASRNSSVIKVINAQNSKETVYKDVKKFIIELTDGLRLKNRN